MVIRNPFIKISLWVITLHHLLSEPEYHSDRASKHRPDWAGTDTGARNPEPSNHRHPDNG